MANRQRSPMDRAADGMQQTGKAMVGMYNAIVQVLPAAAVSGAQVLALAERAVVALERLADTSAPAGDHCTRCGQRVDLHDDGVACRP